MHKSYELQKINLKKYIKKHFNREMIMQFYNLKDIGKDTLIRAVNQAYLTKNTEWLVSWFFIGYVNHDKIINFNPVRFQSTAIEKGIDIISIKDGKIYLIETKAGMKKQQLIDGLNDDLSKISVKGKGKHMSQNVGQLNSVKHYHDSDKNLIENLIVQMSVTGEKIDLYTKNHSWVIGLLYADNGELLPTHLLIPSGVSSMISVDTIYAKITLLEFKEILLEVIDDEFN